LQASDAAANDTFGTRISISHDGDTIAVGSYHARDATRATVGKAYVFVRSNGVWTEQAKLLASDAATADYFGSSVSLSADGCALAVGAYATDNAGLVEAGRAYLYTRDGDTWTERSRIQASDPAERDYFGQTVSLSGDATTLAVGAYGKNNSGGIDAGNVYVFSLAPDPKIGGTGNLTLTAPRFCRYGPATMRRLSAWAHGGVRALPRPRAASSSAPADRQ
jgi:hypothetical protein